MSSISSPLNFLQYRCTAEYNSLGQPCKGASEVGATSRWRSGRNQTTISADVFSDKQKEAKELDSSFDAINKKWICKYCSKSVTDKRHNALTHLRTHGPAEVMRRFACEHCGGEFTQNCSLKRHKKKCKRRPFPPVTCPAQTVPRWGARSTHPPDMQSRANFPLHPAQHHPEWEVSSGSLDYISEVPLPIAYVQPAFPPSGSELLSPLPTHVYGLSHLPTQDAQLPSRFLHSPDPKSLPSWQGDNVPSPTHEQAPPGLLSPGLSPPSSSCSSNATTPVLLHHYNYQQWMTLSPLPHLSGLPPLSPLTAIDYAYDGATIDPSSGLLHVEPSSPGSSLVSVFGGLNINYSSPQQFPKTSDWLPEASYANTQGEHLSQQYFPYIPESPPINFRVDDYDISIDEAFSC